MSRQNQTNPTQQSLVRVSENQIARIQHLPNQMQKINQVIKIVLLDLQKNQENLISQNHDQMLKNLVKIILLDQTRKTIEALNPVIILNQVIKIVLLDLQKNPKNPISQNHGQMLKNPVKIILLDQTKKTIEALNPVIILNQVIKIVLLDLQKNPENLISQNHDQTLKNLVKIILLDQTKKTIEALDLVIILNQVIKIVLLDLQKNPENLISQNHDQTLKNLVKIIHLNQTRKTIEALDLAIILNQVIKIVLLDLQKNPKNPISQNHDQALKNPVKIILLDQTRKTIEALDLVIILNQVKKIVLLDLQKNQGNLISQNHDQALKNPVKIILLDQTRKTIEALDLVIILNQVIKIVLLDLQKNQGNLISQNHDQALKNPVKIILLDQTRKTIEALNPVIILNQVIKIVLRDPQKNSENLISQNHGQTLKNLVKIILLLNQTRKTIEALDQVIKILLPNLRQKDL